MKQEKLAQFTVEMRCYNMHILGIRESRWIGSDRYRTNTGETMLHRETILETIETITNTTRESHRPEERNREVLDDANQQRADEDQNDGEAHRHHHHDQC